ncbi:MAG: N-acetylmuramoyl-L-alanine amidase family protein [Christensenellales bacterium]|jgi:N-acetylmuramoyl-L-alanine amidase
MLRKILGMLLILTLCPALALCEQPDPDDIDPAFLKPEGRLSGIVIGIDAGHQAHANMDTEPVAPGSKEKKPKVAAGTRGVKSKVAEYIVNLDVSLKLQEALEKEGATVIMARTENDVDISNIERAQMMNEGGAQLFLRLHCNGVNSKSKNGIGLYVRKTGGKVADEAYAAAEIILECMVSSTGAREDGLFRRDTYSGLNWAKMPSILVEMGYMTNPEEDLKLNDPEYQNKLVQGMVEGVCRYFETAPEKTEQAEPDGE